MPAARGVKRAASKSSAATASSAPKNKKKRGAIQLEIPSAPKKRGRVLTCGQGDVGQLGLGEDVIETTKFKYVTALGDKIVEVRAGGMHTVALDSTGKVWTFGCNDEGALGRATAGERDEGAPRRVALPARAVRLAAGDSHSAALLHTGDVYAWGAFRDSHGTMGLVVRGREGKACREPVKVDIGEPAVDVASGGDHLVILSASGAVYSMGCGEQGQLGRLAQRSASRDARHGFSALLTPAKVTLKFAAARVWAGYHATFALDAAGDRVFAWGLNNYGQLGITGEKRKTALYSPTECDAFGALGAGGEGAAWRGVACGQHHSLALAGDGRVFAVGRCEYGRLGLGDKAGDAEVLEPIPALQSKKCVCIAAGTCNSFAVTDSGEVLAWGMGSEGQLGTGACVDAAAPAPAHVAPLQGRAPPALAAAAGAQHTVLLVEDPSSLKESSPAPEAESAEEKTEDTGDTEEEEEEKKPRPKRPKKEQEGEISSTSSAQPSAVGDESKPQKVNGDEKKETPMEVDETDNTDGAPPPPPEPEPAAAAAAGRKPESTDSSSQDTTESDSKSQDTDKDADVDMEKEVNGAPEPAAGPDAPHPPHSPHPPHTPPPPALDAKTVDTLMPTAAPLTTSA